MLQLDRGAAMRHLTNLSPTNSGTDGLTEVVDARTFGLPQRRLRVIMVRQKTEDPRPVLFGGAGTAEEPDFRDYPCGFYWTEGVTWAWLGSGCCPNHKGRGRGSVFPISAVWLKSGGLSRRELRAQSRLKDLNHAGLGHALKSKDSVRATAGNWSATP